MSDQLVHIDRNRTGIALVSMMRAEKRNALNLALLEQLGDAFDQLNQDATCRVLILRGDGPTFCAGLDLVEACNPDVTEKSAAGVRRVVTFLRESRIVSIAAASGGAYAGGAGLLAACDLAVISDDLRLGFPEVRRGLVAAIVWSVVAPKVRDGDLRELLFVAEPISAQRAQMIGLAQWIEPADRVIERAISIAESVLAGGPEAVKESKFLLNRGIASADAQYLQDLHERVRHGAEAREGLAAFRDRRQPSWCQDK